MPPIEIRCAPPYHLRLPFRSHHHRLVVVQQLLDSNWQPSISLPCIIIITPRRLFGFVIQSQGKHDSITHCLQNYHICTFVCSDL